MAIYPQAVETVFVLTRRMVRAMPNALAKLQPSHNKRGNERSEQPVRSVGWQLQRSLGGAAVGMPQCVSCH
jgi:hypothetical protein